MSETVTGKKPRVSVVIGFKDWGLDRLCGAIRSIKASYQGNDLEIIIVDYGSEDNFGFEDTIGQLGARYRYVETNGVWSRSRSLNIGLGLARGDILITTDADMVFSPGTICAVADRIEEIPNEAVIVQCRDLPEGIDHEMIETGAITWEEIEANSRFRPRWGMGGLIAFNREAYILTRGLDERMVIYGGEDIDLAKRLARVGYRRVWMDDPNVRMYHVWHPPSRKLADEMEEGARAIRFNQQIHKTDPTRIRNLMKWRGRPASADPLVTVAISTFNRGEYIRDAIDSVLAQTFQDFEIIVISDGSTDNTDEVMSGYTDPRIRYYRRPNRGLAATRNEITDLARGRYIAVHDDDDIMLPTRLEDGLKAMIGGINATYGGWVDFDNVNGTLVFNPGKKVRRESLLFNSATYLHPTLMAERWLFECVRYNHTMKSGSDFNLAIRMVRNGAKFKHCGKYMLLRRNHPGQITNSANELQKSNGVLTSFNARVCMTAAESKTIRRDRAIQDAEEVESESSLRKRGLAFLPDHLVERSLHLEVQLNDSDVQNEEQQKVPSEFFRNQYIEVRFAGEDVFLGVDISDVSFADLCSYYARFPGQISTDVNFKRSEEEFDSSDFTEHGMSDIATILDHPSKTAVFDDLSNERYVHNELVNRAIEKAKLQNLKFFTIVVWEADLETAIHHPPVGLERFRVIRYDDPGKQISVASVIRMSGFDTVMKSMQGTGVFDRDDVCSVYGVAGGERI